MVKPDIRDIKSRLPHANTGSMQFRELGTIKRIAVHYDDEPRGAVYDPFERYVSQANFHINKVWGRDERGRPIYGFGLMYHYKISGDGRIWATQPEELITWHVTEANPDTLGICLDCGEYQQPTKAQLDSLVALLDWLCYERPDMPVGYENVWGHGELREFGNSTACPGPFLPWAIAYRNGKWGRAAKPEDDVEFIPETGHYVGHGFRELYHKVNSAIAGVFVTGFPISEEEQDDIDSTLTVQYFENTRMEWKPGWTTPRFGAVGRFYRQLKGK